MRSHLVYTLHFLLFPIRLPLHSSLLLLWHNLNYEFIYIYINFVDCTVHSVCVCARLRFISPLSFRISGANVFVFISFFLLLLFAQSCNRQESWITEHVASELPTATASCRQGGVEWEGGEWGDNNASCCNNAEAKTVARRGVNFTNTNTTTPLPHFLLPPFLPLYTSLPYTHLPLYCHSLPALHIILCLLNL